MSVKRLDKLPQRKVTVDELLQRDDINEILNDLLGRKNGINQLCVLWVDDNGESHTSYQGTGEVLVWMLEKAKLSMLGFKFEDVEE